MRRLDDGIDGMVMGNNGRLQTSFFCAMERRRGRRRRMRLCLSADHFYLVTHIPLLASGGQSVRERREDPELTKQASGSIPRQVSTSWWNPGDQQAFQNFAETTNNMEQGPNKRAQCLMLSAHCRLSGAILKLNFNL